MYSRDPEATVYWCMEFFPNDRPTNAQLKLRTDNGLKWIQEVYGSVEMTAEQLRQGEILPDKFEAIFNDDPFELNKPYQPERSSKRRKTDSGEAQPSA